MAKVFDPAAFDTRREGQAAITVLADRSRLGSAALGVEHLALAPGSRLDWAAPAGAEAFIYVITGAGTARVAEAVFALDPEALVWLEPGDSVRLEAAAQLEVLACRAPS